MKIKNNTYIGLILLMVMSFYSCRQAGDVVFDFFYTRAQAATSNVNVTLSPGTLSMISSPSATTNQIDLDNLPDSGEYAMATFYVNARDHRAGAPGWSMTTTCSDFSDGGSNIINVSRVAILPDAITPVDNSSLTGVSAGGLHYFTGTSDAATLMTASTGNGRGRFIQLIYIGLMVDVADVPAVYSATVTQTVS